MNGFSANLSLFASGLADRGRQKSIFLSNPTTETPVSVAQQTNDVVHVTPVLQAFIDEWKDKQGNLIMILHQVQEIYGYIPREVAIEISRQLHVPLAKIYGVVTFYNFFKLQKAGRNKIQVCMGTACYLRGGEDILLEFEKQLGIGVNATTDDGAFSIEAVRCLGCCGLAPVVVINGNVHGRATTKQVAGLIDQYRKAEAL